MYKTLVITHKIVSHDYFLDTMQWGDIAIASAYIDYAEVTQWMQTRELMLSILSPYLKKKDTTGKDLIHLPIDDEDKDTTISNEEVEWYKKFKENYKKDHSILS